MQYKIFLRIICGVESAIIPTRQDNLTEYEWVTFKIYSNGYRQNRQIRELKESIKKHNRRARYNNELFKLMGNNNDWGRLSLFLSRV